MSFVDNLMDMLKNGKEEDGAATARENLSQTWGYPSLVAALPYRYYDDINEIFVNAGSAGFIMEAAPLPGANEQVMAALDDMLRKKLPRQTPVTVIMLASKCVGERIDRGVSNDMWKGGMADHLNKITRAFWQRSALHGLANERDYPLYLRNYRIFLVYGQPLKRASQTQRVIDDLIQIRNTIRVSLGAARNLVEEKIEKTAISIRSVVTNYAKALRYLQGLDDGTRPPFTIREWMTQERYDSSWLFISTQARHRKSVRPLISLWVSLATLMLQSMGENSDRRVWFIIDEAPSLQRIPELAETLAEARKFGGCFVLGMQNMAQLVHVYGRELAKSIFDLMNTRMYGRSPSAEMAKVVEEELGNQRKRKIREQNSYGLDQVRDGVSLGKDEVNKPRMKPTVLTGSWRRKKRTF